MIVVGVVLFAWLIVVHELGHFIVARRNGVEVEEFGIGFPPKVWGRKLGRSKTMFSLNLIPLGGFVKLKGESNADTRPGSFGAARLSAKAKILLAGVGMNVLIVYIIMIILALIGLPKVIDNQFNVSADERGKTQQVVAGRIQADSPAGRAGFKTGDVITGIDGQGINSTVHLRQVLEQKAGQTAQVQYKHGNSETQTKPVDLDKKDAANGILGIVPVDVSSSRYTWSAPIVALGITAQVIWTTLTAILGLVISLLQGAGREAAEGVSGPIGIFILLKDLGSFGFNFLLLLIASLSASLAVFNVLPIPALDGGRLAVIALFKALKKPLTPKIESAIHSSGFVLLIGLVILISYLDVKRFF